VVDHRLFMDNFFSSPKLFDDLHTRNINVLGLSNKIIKKCQRNHVSKTLKFKQIDTCARVRGSLTAVICEDKQDMNMLTNMHRPPREGNFCNEHVNAQKPVIVTDYIQSAHALH